jgi:hypothetical protein
MKTAIKLVAAVLVAIPLAGVAQQKLSCVTDISFNKEFLAKFPQAPAACNEVEVVKGQKWARFDAEVKKTEGNRMTVDFLGKQKEPITTMTFEYTPDATVTLENKKVKPASEAKEGDRIVVWVPEKRFGVAAKPGDSESEHFAVVSDEPAPKER